MGCFHTLAQAEEGARAIEYQEHRKSRSSSHQYGELLSTHCPRPSRLGAFSRQVSSTRGPAHLDPSGAEGLNRWLSARAAGCASAAQSRARGAGTEPRTWALSVQAFRRVSRPLPPVWSSGCRRGSTLPGDSAACCGVVQGSHLGRENGVSLAGRVLYSCSKSLRPSPSLLVTFSLRLSRARHGGGAAPD